MKAFKIKEEGTSVLKKGRILYELESQEVLLVATPTLGQEFFSKDTFNRMKDKGLLYEVDLLDETTIHPHLYKPIKKLLKEQLG